MIPSSVGAGAALEHHRLAHLRGQLLRQHAAGEVAAGADLRAADDVDRLVGIALRVGVTHCATDGAEHHRRCAHQPDRHRALSFSCAMMAQQTGEETTP